ncbi:MAG TPA: OsmC family protein [Rhizomicrobium sp.]
MAYANATIGTAHYAVTIKARHYDLISDEPVANGGKDAGPSPYEILLASLASCTAITLRMYADRKQWDLKAAHIDLHFTREPDGERIDRRIRLEGNLSEEQRARIADIAERTPVTLTLKNGVPIYTEMDPPLASVQHKAEVEERLDEAIEESFPASDPPSVDG